MTRWVHVVLLVLLVMELPCLAQMPPPPSGLNEIRQKESLTAGDEKTIRRYATDLVQFMLANTDPDRGGMVEARLRILQEVGPRGGRTDAYRRAFLEQGIAVLKEVQDKAASQAARLNVVMTLAGFQSPEAAPLLQSALEKDAYEASRYWAAKGLAMLAPKIRQRVMPRLEAQIADTIQKVFKTESSSMVLLQLFEVLGQFDHERAHDVLAEGFVRVAKTANLADPVVARLLLEGIRAAERAYGREVRAEAKQQLLVGLATVCTRVTVPTVDPRVLAALNAAFEKLLGEDRGFNKTEPPEVQKLVLLEWVEQLVQTNQIPERPEMPGAVEEAVEPEGSAGSAAGAGATEGAEAGTSGNEGGS